MNYRHHIGVKLIISGKIFKDNWIYIHDPNVKMARVSNYLNFSKFMSKDPNLNPVTVEYFCFNSDEVWKKSDSELIKLAEKELRQTQLIKEKNIVISEKNNIKLLVFKFAANKVPKITPKTTNKPKVFTIFKSTALYFICVIVEIMDVGIIIEKEVPTAKCIINV